MTTWTFQDWEYNNNYNSDKVKLFLTKGKSKDLEEVTVNKEAVELFQKYFKAKGIYDLTNKGHSFVSQKNNLSSAIEVFILKLKNGGVYRPPNHQKVLQICTEALAKMKAPDLSNIDSDTVCEAFLEVWGHGLTPNKKWIETLKKDIRRLSNKVVELEDTKVFKKDLPRFTGPGCYFDLVSRFDRRQTIFIGPYGKPIELLKK